MSELATMKCIPCSGEVAPLSGSELAAYGAQVPEWEIVEGHHLNRSYKFEDFKSALRFVNRVGEIAESEGHHPDIYFTWGKAKLQIFTHAIDGLSESDFILAAKISQVSTA